MECEDEGCQCRCVSNEETIGYGGRKLTDAKRPASCQRFARPVLQNCAKAGRDDVQIIVRFSVEYD